MASQTEASLIAIEAWMGDMHRAQLDQTAATREQTAATLTLAIVNGVGDGEFGLDDIRNIYLAMLKELQEESDA